MRTSPGTLLKLSAAAFVSIVALYAIFLRKPLPTTPSLADHGNPSSKRSMSNPQPSGSTGPREITEDDLKQLKQTPLSVFEARWAEAEKLEDEQERKIQLRGIANTMAMAGYPKEALALVREAIGPGENRCKLITAIFRFSPDPAQTAELFESLEYPDEKKAATDGLAVSLSLKNKPGEFDRDAYKFLGGAIDSFISSLTERQILQHSQGTPEELSAAVQDAFSIPMSPDAEKRTLKTVASLAPFDCWDLVAAKGLKDYETEAPHIVGLMLEKSPSTATERLLVTPNSEHLLPKLFSRWLEINSSAPVNWWNENASRLSDLQKANIIRGIVAYSIQNGEPESARGWAEQIPDQATRQQILQRYSLTSEAR
jgi:hypothetical protein